MIKGLAQSTPALDSPSEEDVSRWVKLGVKMVRFEVAPPDAAGAIGHYALHAALIKYLARHGIGVSLLCGPGLVPGEVLADWCAPQDSGRWHIWLSAWLGAFATLLASLHAGGATPAQVELWNEPNAPLTHFGGAHYAALWHPARQTAKALFPSVPLVSGGVFAHATSGAEYLRDMARYVKGPDRPDRVGWHPYLDPGGLLQHEHFHAFAAEVAAVWGRPISITEAGFQSSILGEEGQANNIASLLAAAKADPHVASCLIFSYMDSPTLHYGLLDLNGAPKPALGAFRAG